jgi:hypothetical protein
MQVPVGQINERISRTHIQMLVHVFRVAYRRWGKGRTYEQRLARGYPFFLATPALCDMAPETDLWPASGFEPKPAHH